MGSPGVDGPGFAVQSGQGVLERRAFFAREGVVTFNGLAGKVGRGVLVALGQQVHRKAPGLFQNRPQQGGFGDADQNKWGIQANSGETASGHAPGLAAVAGSDNGNPAGPVAHYLAKLFGERGFSGFHIASAGCR